MSPPMKEVLEFFFQIQSLSGNTDDISVIAATLANSGICPLNDNICVSNGTVQDTLALMRCSGLYNYSGQWAFDIGLPAMSSSTGAIMIVVPSIMGICVWGPKVDKYGNSEKGILFAQVVDFLSHFVPEMLSITCIVLCISAYSMSHLTILL